MSDFHDLAEEAKNYRSAEDFSMAVIMGKLKKFPDATVKDIRVIIQGKHKSIEEFWSAVQMGDIDKSHKDSDITIEDFYVKTSDEIPGAINKILDALMQYAEKVKQKRMYYSAHERGWFPFDEEDKDKEIGEIGRIVVTIQRLISRYGDPISEDLPPTDPTTFNEYIRYALQNMIMGGING